MIDNKNKAENDLPTLRQMANGLLALVDEMQKEIKLTDEDHLGFMAANFLSKQSDHLHSIILLEPSRDVILIARSMIEGLCQLLWAANKPSSRPHKWRAFSSIEDWRNMQMFIDHGLSVDPQKRDKVAANLEQFGDIFLNKKSKRAKKEGKFLPEDPYCKDWCCGKTIKVLCEEVSGSDLYEWFYRKWSGWHHWNPRGISESLTWQNDRLIYKTLSSTDAASALAVGFQCVIQSAEVTNGHFEMGFEKKLEHLTSTILRLNKHS